MWFDDEGESDEVAAVRHGGADVGDRVAAAPASNREKPAARAFAQLEATCSHLLLLGGCRDDDTVSRDLWTFELGERKWCKLLEGDCLPSCLIGHRTALSSDRKLFIHGGSSSFAGPKRADVSQCLYQLDVDTCTLTTANAGSDDLFMLGFWHSLVLANDDATLYAACLSVGRAATPKMHRTSWAVSVSTLVQRSADGNYLPPLKAIAATAIQHQQLGLAARSSTTASTCSTG